MLRVGMKFLKVPGHPLQCQSYSGFQKLKISMNLSCHLLNENKLKNLYRIEVQVFLRLKSFNAPI